MLQNYQWDTKSEMNTIKIHKGLYSNQEVKGGGLVSLSIPESLVCLCIRAWPVAPPMSNGGPFVVW